MMQKTVEGAQEKQNDEFVDVQVLTIFVHEGARDTRGTENWKFTERIVEVPVVQKEQIQ